MEQTRKLERSKTDRIVTGVCGGFGAYFDVDPVWFRLAFVLLALAGGGGVILYILFAIVMPSEDAPAGDARDTVRQGFEDLSGRARDMVDGVRGGRHDARRTAAVLLILVGAIVLIDNLGWLWWFDAGMLWAIALIGLGVWLLARRR